MFVSDSITEILGYRPHEVQGKSCFDFFHPEEVPFARWIHNRGVMLDKAAVLHYARIASREGGWINCECVFTVVHDVMVACTSIYRHGQKSESESLAEQMSSIAQGQNHGSNQVCRTRYRGPTG